MENALYQQWGLWGCIVTICIALGSGIWWFIRNKNDSSAQEDALEISSYLSHMFQMTIVQEACRLFELIDDSLPFSLTQSRSKKPIRSAFDHFIDKIRTLPDEEVTRQNCHDFFEDIFGRIISKEVQRLLDSAQSSASGARMQLKRDDAICLSLEGDIDLKLRLLAEMTSTAKRQREMFEFSKNRASRYLVATIFFGVALLVPMLVDHSFACYAAYSVLAGFVACLVLTVLHAYRMYDSREWLAERAAKYREPSYFEKQVYSARKLDQ